MRIIRTLATVSVAVMLTTTGCTQTGSTASRSKLYDHLDGLSGDSTLVAVVDVVDQYVDERLEDMPSTVSRVRVAERFTPKLLASTAEAEVRERAGLLAEGEMDLNVRQLGDGRMVETPAPILKPGTRYLLFLTPTMLEGDSGTDMYITGGSAGLYTVGSDGTFTHVESDDGDKLPDTLSAEQLR